MAAYDIKKAQDFPYVAAVCVNGMRKKFCYALYDEKVKAGDTVLVTGELSSYFTTVSEVFTREAYIESNPAYAITSIYEAVLGRVDTTAYTEAKKLREEAAEKEKKRAVLTKKIGAEIIKIEKSKNYEHYAAISPEIAALLEQIKALG